VTDTQADIAVRLLIARCANAAVALARLAVAVDFDSVAVAVAVAEERGWSPGEMLGEEAAVALAVAARNRE
jgi:hypothetical protein